MKTYVYEVTTLVKEEWYVEAHSQQEAYEILFSQGEVDESTKQESVSNVYFVGEED